LAGKCESSEGTVSMRNRHVQTGGLLAETLPPNF
jgi:hypothetical protein